MKTPPRPRGGQCGTFAPSGSGGDGGCGSSAFGRTRRRGHQGEPYTRAPATVASLSHRNVQGSRSKTRRSHHQAKSRLPAMPTTGAPALAGDALEPGREDGLQPRHLVGRLLPRVRAEIARDHDEIAGRHDHAVEPPVQVGERRDAHD